MTDFLGRLRTPRLSAAPASPVVGELYYDTGTNLLYCWNGTAWTADIPAPASPGSNDALVWSGTAWVSAKIAQANVNFPVSGYTPSWTSSGTAPAIGNGTIVGQYAQAGKLVIFHFQFVFGSTTTFGTGTYSYTLPTNTTSAVGGARLTGWGQLYHASNGNIAFSFHNTQVAGGNVIDGGHVASAVPAGTDNAVAATVPWTWANGDVIRVSGSYLAA